MARHTVAGQDFHRFLNSVTVRCEGYSQRQGDAPPSFIPADAVKIKFTENNYAYARKLRDEIYKDDNFHVSERQIADSCPIVFAILLSLGRGEYIRHFLRQRNLHDDRLPFHERCLQDFPSAYDGFFDDFRRKQWLFLAPLMKYCDDLHIQDEQILPFVSRRRVKEGTSAYIDEVIIHPSYDGLVRRPEGSGLPSHLHRYAVKTYYGRDAESYYTREAEAFQRLEANARISPCTNFIGFYGSFVHRGSYNIILELADMSLEDCFRSTTPPSDGNGITGFWAALLKSSKALVRLHEHDMPDNNTILQGWHQDVKPSNILIVCNGSDTPADWDFKLADLGLSHFKAEKNTQRSSGDQDTYGTRTYAAPECCPWTDFQEQRRNRIETNADIWSFGCVCSEAAVWVVHGWYGAIGLEAYRVRRAKDPDKMTAFRGGNCFHNGEHVRKSVLETHDKLVDDLRKSDEITGLVLERIIRPALGPTPDTRMKAKELWYWADQCIKGAKGESASKNIGSSRFKDEDVHASRLSSSAQPRLESRRSARSDPSSEEVTESPASYNDSEMKPQTSDWSINTAPDNVEGSYTADSSPIRTVRDRYSKPDADNLPKRSQTERHGPTSTHRPGARQRQTVDVDKSRSGEISGPVTYRTRTQDVVSAPPNMSGARSNSVRRPGDVFDQSHVAISSGFANTTTGSTSDDRSTPRELRAEDTGTAHNHLGSGKGKQRDSIPFLPVERLLEKSERSMAIIQNKGYINALAAMDHLFLVDDSESMRPFWREAEELVGVLAYVTKVFDSNGVELLFMSDPAYKRSTKSRVLKAVFQTVRPNGRVDARARLSKIIQHYLEGGQTHDPKASSSRRLSALLQSFKPANGLKPLKIYVLTTGVWQPGCELDDLIVTFVNELSKGVFPMGVGIQFIRFGNDSIGKERLRRLDDDLALKEDIIDTEPSNGNVLKMLLGPGNEWFDNAPSQ